MYIVELTYYFKGVSCDFYANKILFEIKSEIFRNIVKVLGCKTFYDNTELCVTQFSNMKQDSK